MSSIDHHADRMPCVCPPPASDSFLSIVSWTGWAIALAAILVMTGALGWLLHPMSRGINCATDRTTARLTLVALICVPAAIAGSLVGAFVPH